MRRVYQCDDILPALGCDGDGTAVGRRQRRAELALKFGRCDALHDKPLTLYESIHLSNAS